MICPGCAGCDQCAQTALEESHDAFVDLGKRILASLDSSHKNSKYIGDIADHFEWDLLDEELRALVEKT